MNKPIIMVSSTCFDLKQIRSELQIFIENFGYDALLSESSSFPINTEDDTIDNCKKKVKLFADILVLIIGGRYGYIDNRSGKSITNLEYIEARNKGIPIYVFIENKILNYLDIWKNNKSMDFSSVVDTTEVFNFIERVRNLDSVWTFSFDVVKDIRETLSIQLSYLFKSSLDDRLRIRKTLNDKIYDSLSTKSLMLVLEKPDMWEYRLFFQVWIDEIELIDQKVYEYNNNLKLFSSKILRKEDFFEWVDLKVHEMLNYIESANHLISEKNQEAFGPQGIPGNPKEIIIVGKNMAKLLSLILDWSLDIRLMKVEDPLKIVLFEMSRFSEQIISELQSFPRNALEKIDEVLMSDNIKSFEKLRLTIVFEAFNMDNYNKALKKAESYFRT